MEEYLYGEFYRLALIGKKLDYSYSKIIHEKYMGCSYDLVEIKDDKELDEFFKDFKYDGINVTNPYKQKVIKYCAALDDYATATQSVNTIVNHNGKLVGYNTDYFGFDYLVKQNKIDFRNKKIFVLGTGGVSNTLKYYLKKYDVTFVSRQKTNNYISYEDLLKEKNVDIIINATPVGVSPNIYDINENVEKLLKNKKVLTIDLNYNPNVSYFSFLSNKSYNGLQMLVKQAEIANNLITDRIEEYDTEKIVSDLTKYRNICIIGMMGSGKTTYASNLAKKNKMNFVDIDSEIEKYCGKKISEIFAQDGEQYFREIEEKLTLEYNNKKNYVISCGGGIVLNEKVMFELVAYSQVLLIDTDIEDIINNIKNDKDNVRPLAKSEEDIRRIYKERKPLYKKYAMKIVKSK